MLENKQSRLDIVSENIFFWNTRKFLWKFEEHLEISGQNK